MVLIEKMCYEVGRSIGTVLYYGTTPTAIYGTFKTVKCFIKATNKTQLVEVINKKVNGFVERHILEDDTAGTVSENLFKCLDYID